MSIANRIVGSEKVTAVFGRWPSFHDAEVFEFNLDRRGPDLRAFIYVFEMTSEVDPKGFYVLKNQSIVGLYFGGLVNFAADGFNHQNVLFDLQIADISTEQLEDIKFEVTFDGIFGLDSKFRCRSIEVESVEPMQERTEVQKPSQSPPRPR
jgi:hypothetical protein